MGPEPARPLSLDSPSSSHPHCPWAVQIWARIPCRVTSGYDLRMLGRGAESALPGGPVPLLL